MPKGVIQLVDGKKKRVVKTAEIKVDE